MNSATDIWPDGLGSSSGELGHNLMDHHLGVGAGGNVEGYEDKYYFGFRPNGILYSAVSAISLVIKEIISVDLDTREAQAGKDGAAM